MDKDRVSRQNRFAKFHAVSAHEIADATGSFCQFEQQDAGHLRHGFDLHHAWHHRMAGEMSLKERLVDPYCFDPDAFGFSFKADDAIHHQKRETMRQDLHYLVSIEFAVPGWHCSG